MSVEIGTKVTVDLKGTGPKFSKIVKEIKGLTSNGEKLASYDGDTRLWTVHVEHRAAANAVDYAASAGATVTTVAADPTEELRAERERLLKRLAEIDEQLGR